jgi:hypothetical protein
MENKKKTLGVSLIIFFILAFGVYFFFGRSKKSINKDDGKNVTEAIKKEGDSSAVGPPVIVYKTKSDFFDKLSVVLADKTKDSVVSYPDVKDMTPNSFPTKLDSGYLLDNRGLNKSSAFLKITYTEFGAMKKTPTPDELYKQVLEKDPFLEMYECGTRYQYKNLEDELNGIIKSNGLNDKCKKII